MDREGEKRRRCLKATNVKKAHQIKNMSIIFFFMYFMIQIAKSGSRAPAMLEDRTFLKRGSHNNFL
jgi:hypothetical protein